MNKDLMRSIGFGAQVDLIEEGKCPFCKKIVEGFEDVKSYKEFQISGLCQKCQDDIWTRSDVERSYNS